MPDLPDIPEAAVEAATHSHFWDMQASPPEHATTQELEPYRDTIRPALVAALSALASTPEGRAYLLRLVFSEEELQVSVDDGRWLPEHESAVWDAAQAKLRAALGEER